MPEFSNYLEGLTPVVGALSGDEIIGASKNGDAVSLTPTQIAALGGGGGTWGSITGTIANQTDLNPYLIDSVSSVTTGGTITLNMGSKVQRIHVGSASFSNPKTLAMSNITNSLGFTFFFEITDVAAVLTVPADWLMADFNFDGTDWTPGEIGKYEMGGSWNGTNWYVKVVGPFS